MAKLGEVCDFYAGTGFPNEYQGRVTGKYPFYKVGDISKNVLEGNRELKICANYVDEEVVQKLKGSILPPKTIVFAKIGEALKLNRRAITSCECLVDNNVMGIKAQNSRLNDEYLFYWLQNLNLSDYSESTTVPSVKKSRLQNIEIKVSPLEEQEKVVSTLNKLSDLILARKKQLSKLDELVKARFVEMFGNPASNTMGWKSEQLVDCLQGIDNGKSFVCSNDTRQGQEPAMLKLSAVTYGVYNQKENKVFLDDTMFIKAAEVHRGDLLFTRKNTPELVGMCAYVTNTEPNLMMPDLIFRLNPNDKINAIFLWKLINHELFREKIQNIATGSAKSMSNISKERLGKLKIIVPPIPLQNQFASFVERIDQQKQVVQQSLEKLELMKKALMQEYFG